MATESIENVIIFRADTGEAVRTVGDLRENIKAYKAALDQVEIGTKEYDDTLKALQINQAALKDAMHATTSEENQQAASMESIAKAAMGAGNSYNALVKRMAELDQAFRREEDTAKRDALGAQIKSINAQLKEMDEQRGKFGRNVGNYKSALDGLTGTLGNLGSGARAMIQPIKNVDMGFKALSANPVIGTLGLLAAALGKVLSGLKTSEENTMAWSRAMAAFKPIADSFTRTMQAVGKSIADTANWIVGLLEKWGLLNEASQQRIALEEKNQRIIQLQRATAINNAQLEQEVAELRNKAAQKEKYTAKERLAFLEQAVKWEEKIAKNNKELAEQRLAAAEEEAALTDNGTEDKERLTQLKVAAIQAEKDFYVTTRRLQSEMATARREIANEGTAGTRAVVEQVEEEAGIAIKSVDELMKMLAAAEKAADERLAEQERINGEITALTEQMWSETTDTVQAELDAQLAAEYEAMMEEREIQQQRKATMIAYVNGVASLASSIAAIYDQESDASDEAAEKAKGVKIAAAIISSIGGAVAAYTSTLESGIPWPGNMILAGINAATALAAGYAQVRQMQAVRVGKNSSTASSPSVVAAPSAPVSGMTQVRTVTGASEEERLNQMASKQKVYLVVSELEAKQDEMKVQLAEATF